MKRICIIILAVLMAQTTFAEHYIGAGVSLSSAFQLDKSDATKPLFGWGEGVTVQYHYQRDHLLLSAGFAVSGEHPRVGIAEASYAPHMRDTRDTSFTYLGSLKNRRDLSSTMWFHMPVMVGFEFYPFYMMAGLQYSLCITSRTYQTAQLAAAADYGGRYYDDYIDDMPSHGYHGYESVSSKGKMKYSNDLRLLVEAGWTLKIGSNRKRMDRLLRIGAFAEIGMLNVLSEPAVQNHTAWDASQYMNVTMNHIYSAANSNAGSVRNIVAGVRVTCLFPVGDPPQKKHPHYKKRKNNRYQCRCLSSSYNGYSRYSKNSKNSRYSRYSKNSKNSKNSRNRRNRR